VRGKGGRGNGSGEFRELGCPVLVLLSALGGEDIEDVAQVFLRVGCELGLNGGGGGDLQQVRFKDLFDAGCRRTRV
jgi:hypothetical protein